MCGSDVDELESHLREQIEQLQVSGLSDDEAFLVAHRRLGNTAVLECDPGEACSAGTCVPICDPVDPADECGEVVIDTCGNTTVLACDPAGVCEAGACGAEPTCDPGGPAEE